MNPLLRRIKSEINYSFFRRYRYRRVARRHLSRYYSSEAPQSTGGDRRLIVAMADGRYFHGGLADRLRSIASVYNWCKSRDDVRFAINFTKPFALTDYLEPAAYDWRLQPGELSFNSQEAIAVYMDNTYDEGPRELRFQRKITDEFLTLPYRQIHVYSSFYFAEADFARDFAELFRPCPRLAEQLAAHRRALGRGYVSVSTRFLELLGDFREPKGGTRLPPSEGDALIARCLDGLAGIITANPRVKVLVTSDSSRFLAAAAAKFTEVYTVDGLIAHVDTTDLADHTKTFLDFLLIGSATTAYQLCAAPMYAGNFSLRAAAAGGIPHRLLRL